MVAPDASLALTVRVISDAAPSVGDVFDSASAMLATTPSSVTSSGVVWSCETVAEIDCVDSGVPLPSVLANSEIANVSLPTGALKLRLHCKPLLPVLHADDVEVSAMVFGAAPLTAMLADCVFDEI